MDHQRGFSLVETLIVVALIAGAILSVGAVRGAQLPQTHVAALGLQAAMAETRALAMSNADFTRSGATLNVVPSENGTLVSVYDSRPIEGEQPPTADSGFPAVRYPVTMNVEGTAPGEPFAILVSSSGYASVALNYSYNPQRPVPLANDPGCDEKNGVAISVSDDTRIETHPLTCREAQYEAVTSPSPAAT